MPCMLRCLMGILSYDPKHIMKCKKQKTKKQKTKNTKKKEKN
jgi:hypothetical protein